MGNDFKQMGQKPLTDGDVRKALENHAHVLVHVLNWINYRQKRVKLVIGWRILVTLGVLYSLGRPLVDATLVQVVGYLRHVL